MRTKRPTGRLTDRASSEEGLSLPARKETATLSLVMIVKNEEEFLRECLSSVSGVVDEIVIVDTGSIDGTMQIAESFGAKIYHCEWKNDFSAARNYALSKATGDWVLHLDADERLDEDSAPKIRELLLPAPAEPLSYLVTVRNLRSTETKYTKDLSLQQRLFARHPRLGYVRPIHEQLVDFQTGAPPKQSRRADLFINHYGYLTAIMDKRDKRKRNLAALNAIVSQDPADSANHFDLGRLLYSMGRMDEALVHLANAVKAEEAGSRRPEVGAMSCSLAALCHLHLSRPDKAMEQATRGVEILATPYSLFVLGRAEMANDLLEQAVNNFRKALQRLEHEGESSLGFSVTVREILANLGIAFQQKGRVEDALEYYSRLIDFEPRTAELYFVVGQLSVNAGHYSEGMKALQSYLDIAEQQGRSRLSDDDLSFSEDETTTRALAYVLLSKAALAQKESEQASRFIEKALMLRPHLVEANLQMTDVLHSLGRTQQAQDIFTFLLRRHPDNADVLVRFCNFLSDVGDLAGTLEVLSGALDRGIHDSRIYQCLGVNLASAGQYLDSANAFELAIRCLPKSEELTRC